jgi:hypothetical protein
MAPRGLQSHNQTVLSCQAQHKPWRDGPTRTPVPGSSLSGAALDFPEPTIPADDPARRIAHLGKAIAKSDHDIPAVVTGR